MATGLCRRITIKVVVLVFFVLFAIFEIVAIGYGTARLRNCNTDVGLYLAVTAALGIGLLIEQGHKWVYIYAALLAPTPQDSVDKPITIDEYAKYAEARKQEKEGNTKGGYLINEPSSSETDRKLDRFLAYELRYFLWVIDIIEWLFFLAFQIYGLIEINGINLASCDNSLYYIACIQAGLHFTILTILIITTVYNAVNFSLRAKKVLNTQKESFATSTD